MPEVKIKIYEEEDGDNEVVSLTFSDEEWEILGDFAACAVELRDSSAVREGMPTSLNISWAEGRGVSVQTKLPPDERIDNLLMKLRPFLLQKKTPTNFNNVRNILWRATGNQRARRCLDTLLFLYSGRRLQSLFVLGASSPSYPRGAIINSEFMLDCWLNGYRFHREKEKRKIVDAMHGLLPPESSVAILLLLIADKVTAVLGLQHIISLLLGQSEKILMPVVFEDPLHYHIFIHPTLSHLSFLELSEETPWPFPPEGPMERVFDLTNLGPVHLDQLIDFIGKLWMQGELTTAFGEYHYYLRTGPFIDPDGRESPHGMDIVATLKVTAMIAEDPLSYARRKPEQALLELMRQEGGKPSSKVFLRHVETKEVLDHILEQDPKPRVEWHTVPRIAFHCAYWPVSKRAREKISQFLGEGRRDISFEEVESTDIARAWEIFEESPEGA